jgi:nucleotide-binding universal stress UspA family protein
MQAFRTILVAADFSENSVHAFRMACALAIEDKTRLVVLHVVAPDAVAEQCTSPGQSGTGPARAAGVEDRGRILQGRMRETYSPSRPIDVQYRTAAGDDAATEILRVADEIGADLIVMGTHGRTGLRRLLAGSVASTVLTRAHGSVLALRAGRSEPKAGAMQVIVHPTDFSRAAEAALEVARALARDHGARLIVLHVVPLDPYLDGKLAAEIDIRDYQRSLDLLRKRLDGPDLKHRVETRLVRGFEAEEILREAQDFAADLIVMGTHGRTGLRRLLMGNTAQSVLPKASCPMLVVKAPPGVATATPESRRQVDWEESIS